MLNRAIRALCATLVVSLPILADTTAFNLAGGNLAQDWTNTGLITTNDNWSGVPSITGYRGDGLSSTPGTNPQTVTADDSPGVLDVNANATTPNTNTTGGVTEFHITNPVVALQGSSTADAPNLQFHLNTTNRQSINVAYNVRDIDGSADNAVQQVALQYRVGNSGVWTDLPAGYIADATTVSTATQVTAVSVTLPAAANNQPLVQVRVITNDAVGSDEWVGIDDIVISSAVLPLTLSIDDVTVTEGNAGTILATFTVSLNFAAPANVTFDIATADNTATTSDSDYVGNSLTGQIIPTGSQTYTFDVTVNGDANVEPHETFFVNVTNVSGATVGDGQGQGTISSDDVPPQLSIADPTPQNEGNAGTSTMTFTVTLDAPAPPGGVTFDIATADGTATDADNDYEPNSVIGSASIAQGNTTYNFPVTINGDTKFEADESFGVTVTNVAGATVSDNGAVGTIDNDDAAPALAIASAAVLEGNAGTQTLTFTVTMTGSAGSNVTVDWATSDSSATVAGSDYVAGSGTLTFIPGDTSETFDVTVNGDTNIEGDEQFLVTLSNATGGAIITNSANSPNPAFGVIKSDDAFSLAAVNTTYSQNFDTLASATSATTPATWTFAETGTAANLTYNVGDGSSNAGNTYSFGATGNPERAFGGVQSGSLIPTIGGQFVNNTGEAITTLSIAYTGEQWRLGATGRADRLDFQYSTSATSLTTGTWTHVDALDFTSPFTSANAGDVGARDGNAAPNRANVAYTIGGLNIAPGATFWIRWTDFNASGADDGLAVDDFSIIANIAGGVFTISDATVTEGNAGTVTATFTVTLSQAAGVGGVSFDIATADNTATVADSDYVANTVVGANIPQGSTQYTFDVTVNGDTNVEPSETFFVNVTNLGGAAPNDLQGLGTIGSDDFTFTRIHAVQGSGDVSPLNGSVVTVGGIVTGIKSGGSGGFFVQEEVADYDSDPNTSEGIFVFTGGSLPAGVAIGNTVAVTGTISEFPASAVPHGVTELSGVTVDPLGAPQPLPAPVVLTPADGAPSSNISQYERYEGMRVTASLTVVAPTQGSVNEANATSTSNGVFYAVITGTPRPFREIGIEQTAVVPAEAACPACIDRFDMNPEKLRVDSDNQPGATQLNVAAGQTVTNIVGPLDFGFFEYTILPDAATVPIVAGDSTFDPVRARTASELTVSSFNLERFYDTIDDGPTSDAILTATAFNNRLNKASLAIRNALLTPDVIGLVEVENLTTAQALAAKINVDTGGVTNYVAYLEEGNDIGGIDVGFLVNENRVTTGSVTQIGKTATFVDPSDSSVDILNDRPSLVLEASIPRPDTSIYDFVVVVNHLRSLNGVETDDASGQRIRAKRAAQAEYLANYVQGRQTADPAERIILVGDFNAFEFHDGYVDLMGTIVGNPAPATEVVRASADLVDPNLINLVLTVPAALRYSYSFDGNAQVLDHAVVTQAMAPSFNELQYAHLDADFPETFRGDATRPERISDHDAPVAYFALTTRQISIADGSGSESPGVINFEVTLDSPSLVPVTVDYATSSGTATDAPGGQDYTTETGTVTFAPGDVSETIDILIVEDGIDEPDETFTVTLSNPSIDSSILDGTATGTILDNDDPPAAIVNPNSIVETDATQQGTITVTLSGGSTSTITVDYTTQNGTATAGSDYVAESGTLTFVPGDGEETITLDILGDNVFEGSEQFQIVLSNPTNATVHPTLGSGAFTIQDDETAPSIVISDGAATEINGSTTMTFNVSLSGAAAGSVTVNYATADGTAVNPDDYTSQTGTVTFGAGDVSETISITIPNDLTDEPDETFTVTLSNPSANSVIGDGTATGTITDNDGPPSIHVGNPGVTETDTTQEGSIQLSLNPASGFTVTVDYTTQDSGAIAGSDYVAESGTVTFLPGETSKIVTLDILGDDVYEGAFLEQFRVILSNPVNATAANSGGEGQFTIQDDDAMPTVSVADSGATETDGNVIMTFNVSLTGTSGFDITVLYTLINETATNGADFTDAGGGSVTIPAGQTSTTISVNVLGDEIDESSETFRVEFSGPPVDYTYGDSVATGTITDDEPTPTVSIADNNVIETDATTSISFTVTLSGASSSTVTVDYATSDGTATSGADYTAETGTVTFPAGDVSETITIDVLGDNVAEGTEDFTVTLSNVSASANINDASATGTIFDDEGAPVLIISDNSVTETDGTTTITFNVALSVASDETVTVDYATSNGSATAASDYTAETGTLTFAPGDVSETITIDVLGDNVFEGTETFLVTLSNNSAGASIGDGEATGTITDDETIPSLSIADKSEVETDATVTMTFTVTLSGPASSNVTVNYATADDTAVAGADYVAESGTLTFSPGDVSETITIDIIGDNVFEGTDEHFFVNLSSPSANATIADNQAIGTINDADPQPLLSLSDGSVTETDATIPMTFTVTLDRPSANTVTAEYTNSIGGGTATGGTDFTVVTGTVTFAPGDVSETFTIDILGDNITEGTEFFNLALGTISGGGAADPAATGTIFDDEVTPSISIADANVTETDTTTQMTFTVTLSNPSATGASVTFTTASGTATSNSDFTGVTGGVVFDAGDVSETITIDVLGDDIAEGTEAFTVTLSNPSNATIADGEATGTIFDDESAPVLIITDATVTETNGTSTMTFNVSLSGPAAGTVQVDYATSNGTATAGTDYTAETGTLTFAPGDLAETITIDILGDTGFEGDETFLVTLSNVVGDAAIGDAEATGTIVNDDPSVAALTLTKSASPQTAGLGENVTYTVVVTNNGPQSATDVVVTDDLPEGMTFVSAETTQGTCNAADPVVCNVGTLADDASATITIVARLPFTPGVYSNIATANSDENVAASASGPSNVIVALADPSDIPTLSEYALFGLMAMLAAIAVAKMR